MDFFFSLKIRNAQTIDPIIQSNLNRPASNLLPAIDPLTGQSESSNPYLINRFVGYIVFIL